MTAAATKRYVLVLVPQRRLCQQFQDLGVRICLYPEQDVYSSVPAVGRSFRRDDSLLQLPLTLMLHRLHSTCVMRVIECEPVYTNPPHAHLLLLRSIVTYAHRRRVGILMRKAQTLLSPSSGTTPILFGMAGPVGV